MKISVFVLLALGVGADAVAGNVYGAIFHNGRPVANSPVVLQCLHETLEAVTDKDGVYRLFARSTGNCQIILEPNGRRASAMIYSYTRPTGYSFDLIVQRGRWGLTRR